MLKNQTAKDNQDQFSLIGIQTGTWYSEVIVDFKAPFNLNKSSNSIVPTFLKDCRFYTPAFILPRERENHENNKQFQKRIFKDKISKAETITNDQKSLMDQELCLIVATPGTNYCQICSVNYNCYFQHIQEKLHTKESKESPANEYISELTNRYNRKNKCVGGGYKSKQIKKGRQKKLAIKNKTLSMTIRVKLERDKSSSIKCINNTNTSSQVTVYF